MTKEILPMSIQCSMCHVFVTIEVPLDGFMAWKKGTPIQKAMPTVSKEDRELLISQTCGSCFDKLFGFTENDDA